MPDSIAEDIGIPTIGGGSFQIIITLLLFLLVAGVMAYDFIARGHTPSATPKSALTDDGPPIPSEAAPRNGGTAAP